MGSVEIETTYPKRFSELTAAFVSGRFIQSLLPVFLVVWPTKYCKMLTTLMVQNKPSRNDFIFITFLWIFIFIQLGKQNVRLTAMAHVDLLGD